MESAGAAVVLLDNECEGSRLLKTLRELLEDPERLHDMAAAAKTTAHPAAADTIAEEVFSLVFGYRSENP